MSKNSWLVFGMVAIVVITMLLVALLILVPQTNPAIKENTNEYEQIVPSEYSYTQSKDISGDSLKETYTITPEDIKEGTASKLYRQGNTDPFYNPNEVDTDTDTTSNTTNRSANSTKTTTTGSGTNASTNTGTTSTTNGTIGTTTSDNTGTTTQRTYSVEDK